MTDTERELREALEAMTLRAQVAEAYLQQTENELAETQADLKSLKEMIETLQGAPLTEMKTAPIKISKLDFPSDAEIDDAIRSMSEMKKSAWDDIMKALIQPKKIKSGVDISSAFDRVFPENTKMHVLRMRRDDVKMRIVCALEQESGRPLCVDVPMRSSMIEASEKLATEYGRIIGKPWKSIVNRIYDGLITVRDGRGSGEQWNIAL